MRGRESEGRKRVVSEEGVRKGVFILVQFIILVLSCFCFVLFQFTFSS